MDEITIPRDAARVQTFTLVRVHGDGTEEPMSSHPEFGDGWSAGTAAVHSDKGAAFSLYAPTGERVARFAHARVMPRLSAANLDALVIS